MAPSFNGKRNWWCRPEGPLGLVVRQAPPPLVLGQVQALEQEVREQEQEQGQGRGQGQGQGQEQEQELGQVVGRLGP